MYSFFVLYDHNFRSSLRYNLFGHNINLGTILTIGLSVLTPDFDSFAITYTINITSLFSSRGCTEFFININRDGIGFQATCF